MPATSINDLRIAARRLLRRPRLTAIVLVCLGLGLGATAAVLSVLYPVLLAPLPFADAGRLVRIAAYDVARTDPEQRYWITPLTLEQLGETGGAFTGFAGFTQTAVDLDLDGEARRVAAARTWGSSFRTLGIVPVLGREITDDERRAEHRVAMISEGFWQRHFAADPEVLGETLRLDGEAFTIVGVIPAAGIFPGRSEVWVPLFESDLSPREWIAAGSVEAIGRMAPGASRARVAAELERVVADLRRAHPLFFGDTDLETLDLREALVGDFRTPLRTLLVCSFLVLVIAVVNVLILHVIRAQRDAESQSVRLALGATRRDLLRGALLESLLLAGLAAFAGLLVAHFGTRALVVLAPVDDPAFDRVGLSGAVLAALGALGLVVALVLALTPLLSGADRARSIVGLVRSHGDSRRARRLQQAFVAGQLAVSLMLLVGAGLLALSLDHQRRSDFGLDAERFAAVRVAAPPARADTHEGRVGLVREALDAVRALPGVEAAGAGHLLPLDDSDWGYNLSIEEHPPAARDASDMAIGRVVTPGFFAAVGTPLLRGRDFERGDNLEAPPVAIVSRALEAHYWPDGSAVGKRLKRGAYGGDRPWMEIVGVVGDQLSAGPAQGIRPAVYYPMAQIDNRYVDVMALVARTPGRPEALFDDLRAAITGVDRTATVFRPITGSLAVDKALAGPRFNALVLFMFAAVGLVLAAAGVYGVTAESVIRRRRELAIRMAIGARRPGVLSRVLGSALALGLVGVGVGSLGALLGVRYLRDLLFEVPEVHIGVHGSVAALLVTVVMLSALVPAWRATRIDPAPVLREE